MPDYPLPLSGDDAKAMVREAVARFPNRVNPTQERTSSCLYTDPEDPQVHCIAGQVLVDIGAPLPTEGDSVSVVAVMDGRGDQAVKREWAKYLTADAARVLLLAQREFDSATYHAHPWAEALRHAEERWKRHG